MELIELEKYIEHTNVNPNCREENVRKLCKEAIRFNFHSVVVLPYYVKLARKLLEGTDIKVCTVIGFPYGIQNTKAKLAELEEVINFVDEIDTVMNRPAFKNGDYELVIKDVKALVNACNPVGKKVKVIIETPELSLDEIKTAARLVMEAGADFVKTAVGLKGPTRIEHVEAIKAVVGDSLGIKASGGIRTYRQALAMINTGATRIGSSHGVEIIESKPRS